MSISEYLVEVLLISGVLLIHYSVYDTIISYKKFLH